MSMIAANQNRADGRSGFQRFGLLFFADRTCAHHRDDAGGGELRGEQAHGFFGESVEDERSFDGLQIVGEILLPRPGSELASPGAAVFPAAFVTPGLLAARFFRRATYRAR